MSAPLWQQRPRHLLRPRNAQMAARLNEWPLIALIDGFVVPKLTLESLPEWQSAVSRPELALMPTLETKDVYNPGAMVELLGSRISVDDLASRANTIGYEILTSLSRRYFRQYVGG